MTLMHEYRFKIGQILEGDNNNAAYQVAERRKGGMSEVYLCLDLTHEPIALKIMQQGAYSAPPLNEPFMRELGVWIRLGKHPNITRCFRREVIKEGNLPAIVLEWITGDRNKGNDLRGWLTTGPLSYELTAGIALDVVRGMGHANRMQPGIVHGDLKPENILMTASAVAKITDFGLAVVIPDGHSAQVNVGGTSEYRAPELWRGERPDCRADIYSIGCIIYEMLAGRRPVDVHLDDVQKLGFARAWWKAHEVYTPEPLPLGTPKPFISFVQRCLSKDRRQRYSTFDEMESEIENIFNQLTGRSAGTATSELALSFDEYNARAETYFHLKQYEQARSDYLGAVAMRPDHCDQMWEGFGMRRMDIKSTKFTQCSLRYIQWCETKLEDVLIEDCDMVGADLRGCVLDGTVLFTNLSWSNFRGADLSRARFQNTIMVGAKYDEATRFPEGFNPRDEGLVFDSNPKTEVRFKSMYTSAIQALTTVRSYQDIQTVAESYPFVVWPHFIATLQDCVQSENTEEGQRNGAVICQALRELPVQLALYRLTTIQSRHDLQSVIADYPFVVSDGFLSRIEEEGIRSTPLGQIIFAALSAQVAITQLRLQETATLFDDAVESYPQLLLEDFAVRYSVNATSTDYEAPIIESMLHTLQELPIERTVQLVLDADSVERMEQCLRRYPFATSPAFESLLKDRIAKCSQQKPDNADRALHTLQVYRTTLKALQQPSSPFSSQIRHESN